jgi:hypothetical protein
MASGLRFPTAETWTTASNRTASVKCCTYPCEKSTVPLLLVVIFVATIRKSTFIVIMEWTDPSGILSVDDWMRNLLVQRILPNRLFESVTQRCLLSLSIVTSTTPESDLRALGL